jgi:Ca2+-transporting ATPase
LNSSENGLTAQEAEDRLNLLGFNQIAAHKRVNVFIIFLNQFKNFLVILLLIASVISLFVGEIYDFLGMISIVLLSAILGFVQEYRAEKAMEALKKISSPYAKVMRNGGEINIPAKNLIPGDVVILEEGDIVPADVRIIDASSLQVDESSLTGESVPVKKANVIVSSNVVSEQENMAFMSTVVTYGKGKGIVVNTGIKTEFGKIAETIAHIKETETPLQIKFEKMAKELSIVVLFLVALVFIIGALSLDVPILKLVLFSLSLAVAAVPSSLTAIVTISLGLGAKRLAGKNMIIKQLPAAESLGSVTVICTDKTGTLTKNQMTVTKMFMNNRIIDVTGVGYEPKGNFSITHSILDEKQLSAHEILFRIGYLCNNAKLVMNEGAWSILGDSTEGSLLVLAKKAIKDEDFFSRNFSMVEELPFDSDRKLMSVICENYVSNKTQAYVKGAPDIVLNRCDSILINGKIRKITKKDREIILKNNNMFAEDSLRVLGLAYRDVSKLKTYTLETVEKELVFVGLVGMIDPPREGVDEAIKQCAEAGIRVVMITGDHPTTARSIARQIGLLKEGDLVMTGQELDRMSLAELEKEIENIRIIARAMPIQKTRIVDALQKKGHIVAMTGDGVNDAPALKKADIGIAMGITGTDVSKEVAKGILVDDHFVTIVNAIAEGRNIYDKIVKSTKYLLACNCGEIISVFFAVMLRFPLPMLPLQLLMMNLLTDGLPALGLGSEHAEEGVMKRPPRDPKESPITKSMLWLIIVFGIAMGIGTLIVFNLYIAKNLAYAQTMAFTTLVMFEMFAVVSARSFTAFKNILPFANKWLTMGILTSVLIQIAVIYIAPLQRVFGTVSITLMDWIVIIAVSSFGFILMEISKFFIKEKYNGVHKTANAA